MNMNGGADWEPVVIRKKTQTAAQRKDEAAVNAVRASGVAVSRGRSRRSICVMIAQIRP
jgi:hypothetical protein